MHEAADVPDFVAAVAKGVGDVLLGSENAGGRIAAPIVVDEVRVDADPSGAFDLVIMFRDRSRPRCTFGFRWSDLVKEQESGLQPQSLVNICLANLEEAITAGDSAYPTTDCSPGDVIWV
ncbi:MAG: hypothetical protein M3271_08450 [Actinomycetota bacterium]|nr:hypothetical protein [Actinomycetota bacterium]